MYRIPYEEMERMVIGDRVTRLTAKYLDRRLAPAELTEVGNTLRKRCGPECGRKSSATWRAAGSSGRFIPSR